MLTNYIFRCQKMMVTNSNQELSLKLRYSETLYMLFPSTHLIE